MWINWEHYLSVIKFVTSLSFFLTKESVKIIKHTANYKEVSCLWLEIWSVFLEKYHAETDSMTLNSRILADVLRTNWKQLHVAILFSREHSSRAKLFKVWYKEHPPQGHLRVLFQTDSWILPHVSWIQISGSGSWESTFLASSRGDSSARWNLRNLFVEG